MLPVMPALPKAPSAIRGDRSSLPPDESAPTAAASSASLQEESLMAFLPTQPRFFVGRKEQLENLHQALQAKRIVVIISEKEGFCRIGKTAVSSHYAKDNPSALRVLAHNKQVLDDAFGRLAKIFKVEFSKVRDCLSQQDRLIIFDGAKDPELLKEYLPQGNCKVIITSRNSDWPFSHIEIGPFALEEAVDYLCQVTHKEDRATAKKIAEELDCLPTSLERAALMINRDRAELAGYEGIVNGALNTHTHRLRERSNLGERNRNFTGRETALVALEDAFKTDSRPGIRLTTKLRLASEVGLGGVGKTQIALQYAFRNADKYPYLIWRINCESDASLQGSYGFLAEKLGISLTEEEKKQENGLIKRVNLRLERETGWLLIYDNAENQKAIEGLIPQNGGHVLITSRNPDWDIGFAHVFKIGVFKRKESIALIQKMTPINEADANQLADLVKDLPIAVAQAAAYIRETKIRYTEYARIFHEKSEQILAAQEPTDAYSKTVNVTWQISMEKIAEREKAQAEALSAPYPVAMSLMNLCAFLGSSNIPKKELLLPWLKNKYHREAAALDDLNRALQLLRDFSMIEMNENGISIHDLVQLVTRNQMPKAKQIEVFEQALITLMQQMKQFKVEDVNTWPLSKLCIPHALSLFEAQNLISTMDFEQQSDFMFLLGSAYCTFGNSHQALKINQRGLIVSQEWQRKNPFNQKSQIAKASSFNNIGGALNALGKSEEALRNYCQAHKILLSLYGENHVEIARSLNNAGSALRDLGRAEEALGNFRQGYKIFLSLFGENDHYVASSLNNIGMILVDLGKAEEALGNFRQAYRIFLFLYGENHPEVARSLKNIGRALLAFGKAEEALRNFRKAHNIRQTLYGESHPDVGDSLNDIGGVLNALGKAEEALENFCKAHKIFHFLYGESHPIVAVGLNNIGGVLQVLGKPDQALENFRQAHKILQSLYGANHPDVAKSLSNICSALHTLGKAEDALANFRQAHKSFLSLYGANHPLAITSLNNIGMALFALGKPEEALENFRQAHKILQSLYGANHPELALSLNNIGGALKAVGKVEEALVKYRQAHKSFLFLYGENHLDVARSLYNIGSTLYTLEKVEEALEHFHQAHKSYLSLYGENHPLVARCLHNIGYTLYTLGRVEEALGNLRQARKIGLSLYGENHPFIVTNLICIKDALQALGKQNEPREHPRQPSNSLPLLHGSHPSQATLQQNNTRRANNVSFYCTHDDGKNLVYHLKPGKTTLESNTDKRVNFTPINESSFYNALSRLWCAGSVLEADRNYSKHLLELLQGIAQFETSMPQRLLNTTIRTLYQKMSKQFAQKVLDSYRNPESQYTPLAQQQSAIIQKMFQSYFPISELEEFALTEFNTFDEYIQNNYLINEKIFLYLSFLKNTCRETLEHVVFNKNYLKNLQILAQTFLDKKYGVKSSSWNPNHNFDDFFKTMRQVGPLIVGGEFGKSYYETPPSIHSKESLPNKVQCWSKGAKRLNISKTHFVIISGCVKDESAMGGGYIYFVDPQDPSDPESPQNDLLYKISYQNLKTYAKKFELMKGYALYS